MSLKLSHVSSQGSKNYAVCNNSRRHGKTFFWLFLIFFWGGKSCRGSRVGCCYARDTRATTVTRDQSQQFLPGMASRPRFAQDQPAPDSHEHNSISRRNFRRCAERDQRIQVAKVQATLERQTSRASNHRSRMRL